jgi:hypothetical protein
MKAAAAGASLEIRFYLVFLTSLLCACDDFSVVTLLFYVFRADDITSWCTA